MNLLRRTNQSNQQDKIARPRRLSIIQAFLIVGVLAASIALPSLAGFQSVPTAAARGGVGGGGQPPVVLPADWPASVPVPAGALQQTVGSSPHWILVILANTGYSDEMQLIRNLYLSNGFVEPNPATAPYFFTNDQYMVSAIGVSHDHSPNQTDIYVHLDRR